MTRSPPQRRRLPATDLYGITHAPWSRGRSNPETVRLMLAAGIRIIQYREKDLPPRRMLEECLAIRRLCDDHGACFIVNDRPDLALLCGADGLHLGQDDLPLSRVRQLVGEEMILGLSTHTPEQARRARVEGADYIGVGPIFRTTTKQEVGEPVGLDYLDWTVAALPDLPKVAIGGIKRANLAAVAARWPGMVCLVTEITDAVAIGDRVAEIRAILAPHHLQEDAARI